MQSIQRITQALNRHGIELLPEELLDAVWLIKCGMVVQGGSSEEPPQQDKPKPKSEEGTATTPQDSSESSDSQQGEGGAKPVYRPGEANDPMDSMAATRFGQSPAIARSLTVERAMRPLRSKRPNKHRRQMDEEETAILSGIAGLPIPILKPTPDRWLHITLITEVSPTMAVWQETAAQLKGLFARAASPASLRSMSMTWQPQRGITLRTEGGTLASHPVQFSGGTQLLLVVSDAMSFGWLTGAVPAQLARWAGSVNTALFQVLPPRMWPQSALRWVLENGNLPELRELRDGPCNLKQRALPVVSLHEQQMRDFAGFIKMGDEGVCAFPPGSTTFKRLNEADISSIPTFDPSKLSENEIEDRLDRFKEASFEAQLLARRLAIVGSLELPVIRLIERSLFKDASPAQFVEMLLSGVIYRVPKTGPALPETDVSNPRYKFLPGLQQRFADQCDRCARYETLRAVGNYLQWHAVGESSVSALIPSDQGNQAAIEPAPFGVLPGPGSPAASHPEQNVEYPQPRFAPEAESIRPPKKGISRKSWTKRFYISAVSGEFEKATGTFPGLLSKLRHHLTAANCEVKVQEDFRQRPGGTLEKLDEYIRDCDAVIHLVGKMPGHLADADSQQHVIDYLAHIAAEPGGRTFLDKQPELLADFGDGSGISLTQFEAYMALHHRLALFVYATPDAASGQQAHLNRLLKGRPRKHASPFTDAADLLGQLIGDLRDIFPFKEQRIAPSRLVSRHTAAEFIGRDRELAMLDDAWSGQIKVHLFPLVSWGGVGKTALLAYWVQNRFIAKGWLNAEGQPEPDAYFDWTFYDQGTRSDDATHAGAASVGTFFQSALRHFGDPGPDSPHDKAARLARLIQAQRSLLILDGLEPLQYPPNHPQAGQLTDPDLRELLGLLAQRNPGLVIVSSRQALSDFSSSKTSTTRQHDLEELPLESAVALLRKMQIRGTDEELKQAAQDYFCHALSLLVLGRFLFVKGGDIRIRQQIPLERANESRNQRITRNAWHVLEAYEQWLASPAGTAADLQALRLTGLFDRPASTDCLAALRKAPAIPGLTDQLVTLSDDAWNSVLLRLHEAHLFQLRFPPVEPGSFTPRPEAREVTVDVHPLIREYFARQLREKQANGFQAAHSRLFDHLCARTEHRPATLEGLQPLFQAVVHGCRAGRQQETCDKVYIDRIQRGTGTDGYYTTRILGAISANLGAVAPFFEEPWSRPSPNLTELEQAWLLNEAAFLLRSLGRLTEAVEPMRASGERLAGVSNWKSAAINASNLSELEVTLGRIEEAVADARRSIAFADRSDESYLRLALRNTVADALHQTGEREEARRLFEQAEAMQRERQPEFDLLYSLHGFKYCDLNLASAERAAWAVGVLALAAQSTEAPKGFTPTNALAEAERRAKQTLEWSQQYRGALLDIALDHLTLARVALYRALLDPVRPTSFELPHATAALDGLRKAGALNHLPRALLTAALHAHLRGDAAAASRALAEAQQIAERGPMPLFLADVHLHRARLAAAWSAQSSVRQEGQETPEPHRGLCGPPWNIDPKAELAKARALIEKHGYWRRKEELEDAEAAAVNW